MNENQETTFDQEGFEAFFRTHPNDANVEEQPVDTPVNDTSSADANTEGETGQLENSAESGTNEGNNAEDSSANDGAQKNTADNKTSQQAHAFAQLRTANKQQQQLLNQIAQVVGIKDTNDPKTMLTALQELVNKAQAQKHGIPEELIARLNTLEATNEEYQRQQAYLAAGRGFQAIKDKFSLEDNDLEAFAQELINDGLNPYEQPIDLMSEYRNRHFDDLIEQAVQRGIDQEARRAAKAGERSSTPANTTGGRDDKEDTKINSIAELNKWLEENKK